jgi:cobalt transporter subunit CbtA
MLKRVFLVALLAGLVAGLATAILQHFTTTPLILAAEVYETTAEQHHAAEAVAHQHEHAQVAAHAEPAKGWAPTDGWERTLSTLVATIVSAIGFALILCAAMLIAGEEITPLRALAWAAGGFAATGLATGLGLSPQLPGSEGAVLAARQLWWAGTAFATALGLYLLLRTQSRLAWAGGILLLVAPHTIGAPQARSYTSTVPAELAAQFAASSLAIHAAFWLILGLTVGAFWIRIIPSLNSETNFNSEPNR